MAEDYDDYMDELTLDFGGVSENPPEGVYQVKLAKWTTTPKEGYDQWDLQFQIEDPANQEWNGRFAFDNIPNRPDMKWRIQAFLECFTRREFKEDGMKLRKADVIGNLAHVALIHNPFGGRVTLKISFNPNGYLRNYQPSGQFSSMSVPQQMPRNSGQVSEEVGAQVADLGSFKLS